MNLVWVYTSNFTSVSTGILSDLNWNHSLNKSMPTLPDAMEIPLWSTHLTKPWQWGIAWRSSRSSADISIGIQGWNNYCRIWVGPLGLLLWGKPFVNIQGMLSPSSRSVTPQWLWWPWRKFFVCLDGGKGFLKHKVTQHEQKTQLNPITQLLNSGNLFWDSFLPKSQSKTLHHCMFSTSWFHLCWKDSNKMLNERLFLGFLCLVYADLRCNKNFPALL